MLQTIKKKRLPILVYGENVIPITSQKRILPLLRLQQKDGGNGIRTRIAR
jgi:hypothetical protein